MVFPDLASDTPRPRPDHALQDGMRIRFVTPRPEPAEGLSVLRADLSAFFAIVERVGRDEALLLLTSKALRQRTGVLALRVNDLAWMLRASNRRIIGWLDRLVHSGHVVYHVEELWGIDTVAVEIVGSTPEPHRYDHSVQQDLPTHWFVQVLPLMGRTTFSVFLYFLWCEPHRPGTHVDHLVATVKLRSRRDASRHLRRLHTFGVIVRHPEHGGLIVRDPSPPSRGQRLKLRIVAIPFVRRMLAHVKMLSLLLALLVAVLAALYFLFPVR